MKSLNLISTIFIITITVYLVSCKNKNYITNTNQKMSPLSINDSCYTEYINSGGQCTQYALHCVVAKVNGLPVSPCYGDLIISGTTCENESFNCVIPLNQAMLCVKSLNVGPKVPHGYYKYKICSELGSGEKWVTVPITDAIIDLNPELECDNNNNNSNN